MYDITSKLEINVFDKKIDPNHLAKVAAQSRAAAVVVLQPELVPHLQFLRASTGASFKVILAIDFAQRGSNFVISKFTSLAPEWMQADGYDIVLSPRPNVLEIKNEVKALSHYLAQMTQAAEVRYCINMLSFDGGTVDAMITQINQQNNPRPAMVRMDQALEMANRDIMEYAPKCLQLIRRISPIPVKVSTNVTLEGIKANKNTIARFDVSLKTAESIIAQIKAEASGPAKVPAVDSVP